MMDALQVAQSIYESTLRNVANKEFLLDVDKALAIATFCTGLAQAEAMERIAMHLGNIHQTLITPDANREPATAADQLKRIGDYLENMSGAWTVSGGYSSVGADNICVRFAG